MAGGVFFKNEGREQRLGRRKTVLFGESLLCLSLASVLTSADRQPVDGKAIIWVI